MQTVAVYEWLSAEGLVLGLGTALELEHWQGEGVMQATDRLGVLLGHEPASMDDDRRRAWNLER